VSQFARICTYDRAGYGWSDAGPLPRTGRQITDELHRLLLAAGEDPPYILVGHSLGGLYARLYATRFRSEVAGLVLVDSRPPAFSTRVPELNQNPKMYRTARFLAKVGLLRLIAPVITPPMLNKDRFSEEIADATFALKSRPEFFSA